MKNGNWVPISKAGKKFLPHDRPYTELEAMFSLQCDYNEGKAVTVLGYANLWRWSRKKVMRFLDDAGVKIEYPDAKKRNQKGHIREHIRDIKGTNEGHIFSFKFDNLKATRDIKGTNEGHIRDISGYTTINNNITNNKKDKKTCSEFDAFIAEFNRIVNSSYRGDEKTKRQFNARIKDYSFEEIIKAVEKASKDSYIMGDNKNGKRYLTPEYITRSDKLDDWLNQNGGNGSKTKSTKLQEDINAGLERFRKKHEQSSNGLSEFQGGPSG